MPSAYQRLVTERCQNLSGGERQRPDQRIGDLHELRAADGLFAKLAQNGARAISTALLRAPGSDQRRHSGLAP
jgi:hypothetical protein